jgi:hypothetical protein
LTEELNETIELNETNRTVFEVFSFNLFSVANSTGYGLNLFALGLQAGKILFNGNYFTYFLSFNDGMTGDAESASYMVNVGPLSRFTNYEQCFRLTCSGIGKECGSWEDGCGGLNLSCGTCNSNSYCGNGTCILDADHDLIPDLNDTLIGDLGDVIEEGFSNIIVKVNESTNLSQNYFETTEINIYDGSDLIINATHNFSLGKFI